MRRFKYLFDLCDILCKGKPCLIAPILLAALIVPTPSDAGPGSFQSFGFFDVEAKVGDRDNEAKRWTFDQHHLTVIWVYDLDDRSRVLFETSYEHGPEQSSAAVEGKIYLPKAYWEFMASDAAKIRIGKFLPPFGIYNERHDATPTLIPTLLPQSVYGKHLNLDGALSDSLGQKVRAYPRFGMGVWLLGRKYLKDWELEYHLYILNGRGDDPYKQDGNTNKGVGARMVIAPPHGRPRIGLSWYSDRNDALNNVYQQVAEMDLEITLADFFLEGSIILPRFEKLNERGEPADHKLSSMGWYVMAGYTLFGRLTPFAYYDHHNHDLDMQDTGALDIGVGINYNLRPSVYLKSEVHFNSSDEEDEDSYRTFLSSLAVAF